MCYGNISPAIIFLASNVNSLNVFNKKIKSVRQEK